MQHLTHHLDGLHAQQASAWIEHLPQAGPEQRAAFVAWLKESPRNVRELLLMLAIDQALDQVDSKRSRDIAALLAQVDPRIARFSDWSATSIQLPAARRRWRWVALAASVLAVLLAGWVFHVRSGPDWREFATAVSEQRAFELEDGSVIRLNTHSRVAVRFSKQARDVRLLEGEAFFKAYHDRTRPFRVYTSDAVIQDVGTQFDVYSRAGGTEIAVLEGRVIVTPQAAPPASPVSVGPSDKRARRSTGSADMPNLTAGRTVDANEEAQVSHAGLLTVHAVTDVADAVAWEQRRLVFRQETLGHIVEEFNRYSHRQIRLEGSAVTNRVYTGVFDADDPDSLAQLLERDTDLSVEKSEQLITIRAR